MLSQVNNGRDPARALVVIGMHRSGTSALAGLLNQLGVEMGSFLMPAQDGVNEKGFWEQEKIVAIHDRLLQYYGLSWDDPRHLPHDWWLQEYPRQCLEEICAILEEDMKASPLWAIKDPRMCRLLPLWRLVFSRLNIEPLFLCIVRNPLEVAASLYARDGMPQALALLLWLQHNLEAVDGTSAYRRRFIGYEQLLKQGEDLLRETLRQLLSDPVAANTAVNKSDQFLSEKLRHHQFSDADLDSDPSVPAMVSSFYRMLIAAADSAMDLVYDDWQTIRRQYADSTQLLQPWLNLSEKLQKDMVGRNAAFEHLRHENELITRALRTAEETIRHNCNELNTVDAALKEAQGLVREKEARELVLDAALKAAQQLVREKQDKEQELDAALKEAQQLVEERNVRTSELEKALEMANGYVRERENDISVLKTRSERLERIHERIKKNWLLARLAKILIRSDD